MYSVLKFLVMSLLFIIVASSGLREMLLFSYSIIALYLHLGKTVDFYFAPQGVGPTTQRAAVLVGVLLPAYDYSKKILLESRGMGDNASTHFM